MPGASLLISSRNYSSWSLRGFLIARLSGLRFAVEVVPEDDAAARDELLGRASSTLVPCLVDGDLTVWDTLAIAEHLHERFPEAGLWPADRAARARARSVSGEMHSGFAALRSALPQNLRARRRDFPVWSAARADLERIAVIWRECREAWGGPWLFGARPCVADAMYAPVALRTVTYGVALDPVCAAYVAHLEGWPDLVEWVALAREEPQEIDELEVEF